MTQTNRVLVIGLDGFEISYAEKLMEAGELPNLAARRDRSAAFLLENPPADRTGLEWAHFFESQSPGLSDRESAVTIDPDTYEVWQDGAQFEPFLERLDARTVVFDAPYVNLQLAPSVRGMVAWGSHDPGAGTASRPAGLAGDIGPYPVPESIYALAWPSARRSQELGESLVVGLEARGRAAVRLMTELTPDWEVFVAVTGELHTANEALWHGVDADHPLHDHPSTDAARTALDATYRAVDGFVERLVDAAGPDVHVVTFNMGGMGANQSDLPSMLLLPELLHRWAYGTAWLAPRPDWNATSEGPPMLGPDESWEDAVLAQLPSGGGHRLTRLARRLPAPVQTWLRRARSRLTPRSARVSMDWMPAAQYARRWSGMDAFALPSYYQGRIRVNLEGRERHGRVPVSRLDEALDELEGLIRACRDPRTGEGVVAGFERSSAGDPRQAAPDHADLIVYWKGMPTALEHPELGLVGPVPYRRAGGHTGLHGFCYVSGPGIEPGGYEIRPSRDVAPTIATLAGGRAQGGQPLVTLPDRVG
jgi:predicted AlkP superfamily phosphohydrolase/phosphomutase